MKGKDEFTVIYYAFSRFCTKVTKGFIFCYNTLQSQKAQSSSPVEHLGWVKIQYI